MSDREMRNLLQETQKVLSEHEKSLDDILWVGTRKYWFTVEEFIQLASTFDYDAGYGGVVVNSDLMLVGEDFWLERGEYDGSEWWELKRYPKRPDENSVPNNGLKDDYDWRDH